MRRYFGALLAGAALSACAPTSTGIYRDTSAPISASTRFDRTAMSGDWVVVEVFGAPPTSRISFDTFVDPETILISGTGQGTIDGVYRVGVPGELIPVSAGSDRLVVFWMDETRETAALGTAGGRFGALIDRDGRVPPDKALAARAIFDFYGWDIDQLNRIGT